MTSSIGGANPRTVCVWAVVGDYDKGTLFKYGDTDDCELFALRTLSSDGGVQVSVYESSSWSSSCDGGDAELHHADHWQRDPYI